MSEPAMPVPPVAGGAARSCTLWTEHAGSNEALYCRQQASRFQRAYSGNLPGLKRSNAEVHGSSCGIPSSQVSKGPRLHRRIACLLASPRHWFDSRTPFAVALTGKELHMTLVSIGGGTPETSLLARARQAEAGTSPDVPLRMNILRERRRSINGIEGEEVLVRARELNFRTTYGFSWDAPGVEGDLLHPYLSLELQTAKSTTPSGKPVDTSLHEDALLAPWDRIASSIRLRNPDTTSLRPNSPPAAPRPPVAP